MSVFINPLTDTGFKIFFGKEGSSEEFLMDFLNHLFEGDPELGNITTLSYINSERVPSGIHEKAPIYDVHCETSTGHRFIVEMQRQRKPYFLDRVTYYIARGITDQGQWVRREGEWDYRLLPVVGVFITDFYIDGVDKKLVTHVREMDIETGKPVGDKIRKAFIQLPVFDKEPNECHTGFDKWIYILRNMERLREMPFKTMKDRVFTRLAEVSKVAALSEEDRTNYERDLKWARDYYSEMKYARETAAAEGRAEGLAEGRAEGRVEGIEQERRRNAKMLKELGVEITIIAKSSGLSEDQIAEL